MAITIPTNKPADIPGWVYWPANLPTCPDGWSLQPVDPRIHSTMDVGRAKTRRRNTGRQRHIAASFKLSNNDGGPHEKFNDLLAFFEAAGNTTTHQGGTDGGYHWFLFKSPTDDEYHFYRFLKDQAPKMTSSGPLTFQATMEWEEYL